MSITTYDAIVIGSGQAGTPLASALAKSGRKTALVEQAHIGGTCVNEGCTPTKTIITSGRVAYLAKRARDYGVVLGEDVKVDMEIVRERKRSIVKSFNGGSEKRVKDAGVDIIWGTARFVAEKEVLVKLNDRGERKVSAKEVFINTGERPLIPDLDGLKSVMEKIPDRILNSTSIMELDEVPEHLIVLGGGYIGLEFGQLFRRLGAEVTVVQRAERLAPREDPEVTKELEKVLEEDGMTLLLSTTAIKVASDDDNALTLTVKSKSGEEQAITGSHILLAAGRTPNTDMLDLEKSGIKSNSRGHIQTNEYLETDTKGVFAMGDVRGPPAFTHISYDDFRILRDQLGLDVSVKTRSIKSRDNLVPYCMFTDPQLAHVGLHLHDIPSTQHHTLQTASMPMSWVARALETDETRGIMKAVVNKETGKILGFTCLGIDGGELMSVVQMAMMGGLGWRELQDAVFAHPTVAESLNNLWGMLKDVE